MIYMICPNCGSDEINISAGDKTSFLVCRKCGNEGEILNEM